MKVPAQVHLRQFLRTLKIRPHEIESQRNPEPESDGKQLRRGRIHKVSRPHLNPRLQIPFRTYDLGQNHYLRTAQRTGHLGQLVGLLERLGDLAGVI